jgi:hypothetical protein
MRVLTLEAGQDFPDGHVCHRGGDGGGGLGVQGPAQAVGDQRDPGGQVHHQFALLRVAYPEPLGQGVDRGVRPRPDRNRHQPGGPGPARQ